jgi:signal transduction histidine kinase
MSHEIKTPLATIKTITKLLKRKTKSHQDLNQHLEVIEQECTEQINRMELIFQAIELESKPNNKQNAQLVNTCLENNF